MQFFYFFPIRFSTAAAAESCYTVPAEGGSEMTYTLYADEVLLLNTVIHYFLMLSSLLLARAEVRRFRILLSALLASVYSLFALLPSLGAFYILPVRILFLLLFSAVAAGIRRKTLRVAALFLFLTLLFGGAVLAFASLSEGRSPLYLARGTYVPVSLRAAAVLSSLLWYLVARLFRGVVPTKAGATRDAVVTLRGKSARLKLLIDTGSALRDPHSNRLTPIVDLAALSPVFSPEEERILREEPPDRAMLALRQAGISFRLFPVRTAAGEEMLLGFSADRVTLDGREKKGAAVALARKGFLPAEGFDGIIGCE